MTEMDFIEEILKKAEAKAETDSHDSKFAAMCVATTTRELYESFIEVGFSDEQAFRLVESVIFNRNQ